MVINYELFEIFILFRGKVLFQLKYLKLCDNWNVSWRGCCYYTLSALQKLKICYWLESCMRKLCRLYKSYTWRAAVWISLWFSHDKFCCFNSSSTMSFYLMFWWVKMICNDTLYIPCLTVDSTAPSSSGFSVHYFYNI